MTISHNLVTKSLRWFDNLLAYTCTKFYWE